MHKLASCDIAATVTVLSVSQIGATAVLQVDLLACLDEGYYDHCDA